MESSPGNAEGVIQEWGQPEPQADTKLALCHLGQGASPCNLCCVWGGSLFFLAYLQPPPWGSYIPQS